MPRSDRLTKEQVGENPKEEASGTKESKPSRPRSSAAKGATGKTAPKTRRAAPTRRLEVATPSSAPTQVKRVPRLLERYRSEVQEALRKEFACKNIMEVPRIEKVVLNIGMGETKQNAKALESAVRDLTLISGQKPVVTRAQKSIAGFKLRMGEPIGTMVTLRGNRMYDFLDKLLNVALPRIRDFRGVSRRAFDGRGNFSLGIREQVIFPEIDYGQIDRIRGLQVSIVTTASTDNKGARLLELLGMPFTRDGADSREESRR